MSGKSFREAVAPSLCGLSDEVASYRTERVPSLTLQAEIRSQVGHLIEDKHKAGRGLDRKEEGSKSSSGRKPSQKRFDKA
jgi:hypothetical protein